jgi:hypothetical protein
MIPRLALLLPTPPVDREVEVSEAFECTAGVAVAEEVEPTASALFPAACLAALFFGVSRSLGRDSFFA